MSSSVFIESSVQPADSSTSDSSLVVVYGKNGISFDDKGLENLIEEKKISSISVVRLTSPTPSMQDEEEEAEKLEEILRKQEVDSADDSLCSDGDESSSCEDKHDALVNGDSSNDDDNDERKTCKESDSELLEDNKTKQKKQVRRRGRQPNAVKQKKLLRRRKRERPEIVGLRLEEFYPPEDANEIIIEALKMAGLGTDKKNKSDYDFQLFVIQNDHCYTPFTSPMQMKAKLAADKIEAGKQAANRKSSILQPTVGKQLFVRKKQQQITQKSDSLIKLNISSNFSKEKGISIGNKAKKDVKERKTISEHDHIDNDDIHSSLDEYDEEVGFEGETDLSETDDSAETDNDRDSDLDFDVNNPKGRKPKSKLPRTSKRSLVAVKTNSKLKRYYSQDESIELLNASVASSSSSAVQKQKSNVKTCLDTSRVTIRSTPSKLLHTTGQANILSPVVAALPAIPKKQMENKSLLSVSCTPNSMSVSPKAFVVVKRSLEPKSSVSQSSPQTHKEIIINKQIMSSPKTKGFTDLTTLIDRNEKQTPIKLIDSPTTPKSLRSATVTSIVTLIPTSSVSSTIKGFMPLETAAKNQLPAQISIQTHQSSSELEAEHDKQLDLINSIVQDEMQKSNEKTEEKITNLNENIPELVKMLESTEKVLVSANTQRRNLAETAEDVTPHVSDNSVSNKCISGIQNQTVTSSSSNNIVGGIDITSASLLATPDEDDAGDLPDDILQQVVELIKDDKTLQEAVEKQVFGTSVCNEQVISNIIGNQNPPPLVPISQQTLNSQEKSQSSSKSIIQMSISNIPTSSASSLSTMSNLTSTFKTTNCTTTTASPNQTSKTTPLLRKEPIQIIRGNGRVITLPPIEAPTTRAKRRAQAQPNPIHTNLVSTSFNSTVTLSESSLDNSPHSNSSATVVNCSTAIPQEKKLQDSNNRRRGSKENIISSNQKTTARKTSAAKKGGNKSNVNKPETESTDSEADDDDDPNKLWCICRQPHNNRFMICCDVCEDWFHGTCVSITKAMGLEMEQKGIDWTCPKCLKKQEEKKQPKITEMLIKKSKMGNTGHLEASSTTSGTSVSTSVLSSSSSPVTTVNKSTSTSVENLSTDNKLNTVENINVTLSKESTTNNIVSTPQLKLQSGQIINLKDFNSSNTKRATIIQTSTNSMSALTPGQKKLFVSSGQANIKMTSQPGTPIRTITLVKQISTQQQQHPNIKVIKRLSPIATTTTCGANITMTTAIETVPTSSASTVSILTRTKNTTLCIVCKKVARSNSIYCSDDCIRKHAQNALNSLMAKSQTDNFGPISTLSKGVIEDKTKRKPKGLFEELLSAADRKPKLERINVYERKSGRIITGSNAPTTANLKKWLQDNPTFEVIQPGSAQALDLEKKQKIRAQHSSSPNMQKSGTSPPPLKMFSSTSNATMHKLDSSVSSSQSQVNTKTNKNIVEHVKSSPVLTSPRPSTPKQLQKYPQQVGIKPDKSTKSTEEPKTGSKEKICATKRQISIENSGKGSNVDGEPIRLVVRRTLKEQLMLRIKEEISSSSETEIKDCDSTKIGNVPKLSEEEVEEFAKATELEMYNFFNRDTGIKYKAKYRSLIFNIKDRKNHTLFAKICSKSIEPKQLVRMSPEEMASQELAQWREQETKHQLEMIKKSELDLLACAKNYVLKTHKGEEVIEGKTSDYANVDISIPVEDVVSALNKSNLPDNIDTAGVRKESQAYLSDIDTILVSNSQLATESNLTHDEDKKISGPHVKDKEKEKEKEKESSKGRDRERDKHHKNKDRHHDKLRSRKKSRSRSRSRSRDKGEKRHRSSHKEEKREREDRGRDRERGKERIDREHHSDVNEKKIETKKGTITHSKQPIKKHSEQQKVGNKPLETYNLIDKILESTKTVEEAANLVAERAKEKEVENLRKTVNTPPVHSATSAISTSSSIADSTIPIDILANLSSAESDQEPTSTVSIPTPPHDPYSRFMTCLSPSSFSDDIQYSMISLWSGNINMVDVTSFHLTIQPVVGNSTNLAKLLPKELDVVGRIGPDTVWDYISKIKKSPNKEIVVIRLIPANECETAAYKILYEYLDNRNRLGVIRSTSPQIKDFYIYPLGAGKSVPNQLQPTEPVEFYDDLYRPDVLLGIIIRVVGSKRPIQPQSSSGVSSTSSTLNKHTNRPNDMDTFTPPGSPKSKKLRQSSSATKVGEIDIDAIIKAPIVAKAQKSIKPPPLSKLKDDDADAPYSPGGSSDDELPLLPIKAPNSVDHTQVAEDDLKRKMEEINRQIAAQEMEIAGLLTREPTTFGSNSASTSNVLANISIPSNLSQILASIKTTGKDQKSVVPPPPPLIGSLVKPTTSGSALVDEYNSVNKMGSTYESKSANTGSSSNTTSLLAKLSDAELLSMVPDDIVITPNKPTRCEEPPPPGV